TTPRASGLHCYDDYCYDDSWHRSLLSPGRRAASGLAKYSTSLSIYEYTLFHMVRACYSDSRWADRFLSRSRHCERGVNHSSEDSAKERVTIVRIPRIPRHQLLRTLFLVGLGAVVVGGVACGSSNTTTTSPTPPAAGSSGGTVTPSTTAADSAAIPT